jgi:hypothetical protein
MNDDLIKVYENMYGSKNSIEQVEQAIQTNLRGSGNVPKGIIEAYSQANGYPKNKPAEPESAKEHIPDEIKPAIEAPEELSPAVDSSESKQKLTKIITDKEKKQMTSQKFSFDELYKIALKEQVEGEDLGGEMGEMEGDLDGEMSDMGGDEITVTLSRDAAQALCDVLQGALGSGEGSDEDLDLEGGDDMGSEMEDDLGDDLEEATEMSKLADAKSGAHDAKNQKVADPTTLNKGRDFTKANIDPHKHVKGIKKPQELKYKVDKA